MSYHEMTLMNGSFQVRKGTEVRGRVNPMEPDALPDGFAFLLDATPEMVNRFGQWWLDFGPIGLCLPADEDDRRRILDELSEAIAVLRRPVDMSAWEAVWAARSAAQDEGGDGRSGGDDGGDGGDGP